jgi:hypothetical protein
MHANLNPYEHAASILENLDGDMRLLEELLPFFTPVWTDWYGPAYLLGASLGADGVAGGVLTPW